MTSTADPPANYDDVNVKSIVLIGVVGAILVYVSIVAVQVIYFRYDQNEVETKVIDAPTTASNQLLQSQRALLASQGGVEQRTPIAEAMSSVLSDYQAKQSQARAAPARSAANGSVPKGNNKLAGSGTAERPQSPPAKMTETESSKSLQGGKSGQSAVSEQSQTAAEASKVPVVAPKPE